MRLPPCHVERSRDISILFPEGTIVRDSSTPRGMTIVAAVYDRRQRQFTPQERCDYAASLSCFLRMSGSFFPSTTARLIVTSAMSSRLGTSYMMSSMILSSIDRNARAPVPFVTAWEIGRAHV